MWQSWLGSRICYTCKKKIKVMKSAEDEVDGIDKSQTNCHRTKCNLH